MLNLRSDSMQQNAPTVKEKFLSGFSSFLSMRRKLLVLFAIVLLLSIIGVAIYSEVRASITDRSTALIEDLEDRYFEELDRLAEDIDNQRRIEILEPILSSLDNIIRRYRGHYAAQRALYLKGEIYFEAQQFERAAENYSALANRYRRSYLAPIALNNAAVSYEELGDNDSAIRYYRRIIDRYYNDYPHISHVLFSLGRLHEATGDFSGAVEYYNMLNDRYANRDWTSDWAVFSRNRIIYLRGAGKI